METYNKDFKPESSNRFENRSGRVWGGTVLVVIGALFLAQLLPSMNMHSKHSNSMQ